MTTSYFKAWCIRHHQKIIFYQIKTKSLMFLQLLTCIHKPWNNGRTSPDMNECTSCRKMDIFAKFWILFCVVWILRFSKTDFLRHLVSPKWPEIAKKFIKHRSIVLKRIHTTLTLVWWWGAGGFRNKKAKNKKVVIFSLWRHCIVIQKRLRNECSMWRIRDLYGTVFGSILTLCLFNLKESLCKGTVERFFCEMSGRKSLNFVCTFAMSVFNFDFCIFSHLICLPVLK